MNPSAENSEWVRSEISNLRDYEEFGLARLKLPEFPGFKKFRERLWPQAENYYSSAGNIFLTQVLDPNFLNKSPRWIVREGLLPCSWFFFAHPLPPAKLQSKIFLHHQALVCVPEAWKPFVGGYDLALPARPLIPGRSLKLLLFTLMMKPYLNPEGLEFHFQTIQRIKQSYGIDQVHLFAPLRVWEQRGVNYGSLHFDVISRLSGLGKIEWIGFDEIQKIKPTDQWLFYDMNDGLLIADGFFQHHFLSNGGILPVSRTYSGAMKEVGTSLIFPDYHMKLFEPDWKSLQIDPLAQIFVGDQQSFELHRFLEKENMQAFPWPDYWLSF